MASIIIGAVLAIGLAVGVVVGVTKLLPWGQDMVAKQDLAAVRTAETVSMAKDGRFLDDARLTAEKRIDNDGRAVAGTDPKGSCYVAIVQSRTGNLFFATDGGTEPTRLLDSMSTGDCLDPAAEVALRTRAKALGGAASGGGTNASAPRTTLIYRCDTAGDVSLPIRDLTSETTFKWSDGVQHTVQAGSYKVSSGDTYTRSVPAGQNLTVDVLGTYDSFNSYDEPNWGSLTGTSCLRGVSEWAEASGTKSAHAAFLGAWGIETLPAQIPSTITDMSRMFEQTGEFPGLSINGWDTSNVTNMSEMFFYSWWHDLDVSDWDTSSVTDMSSMFEEARFKGDVSRWDTSNVTDMGQMFYRKYESEFNSDIGDWDTSKVVSMAYMFAGTEAFNQDIGRWDTSNVEYMDGMFYASKAFNQDISGWNTGKVKSMADMFGSAKAFNQNISHWNVSSVQAAYRFRNNSVLAPENSPFG